MKNIDDTFKNKIDNLAINNLSEASKKRLRIDLVSGIIAVFCICIALIYTFAIKDKPVVPHILYTIAFLVEGIPILFTGIKGLFKKNASGEMELLVSIAIIACYFNGNLLLACIIPLILNIAHILEERSIMGGREIIDGLKKMQQSTATMIDDRGKETTVEAISLKPGQHIIVRPGAIIPIDGIVISGECDIDQKSLTGESKPYHASPSSNVYASTINLDGTITVEVTKEYNDTSFSKILAMLEKSESITSEETGIMNKFLRYYIPFVLSVAAISGFFSRDINVFITVLVASCPCGHMLVSSAPMIASLSVATKRGILIKNSKFIEELSIVDTVVFDKTGTITEGDLSVKDVIPCPGHTEEELIKIAYSIANSSSHPVSRAVVNYCKDGFQDCMSVSSTKEIPGKGIEALLQDNKTCLFGNKRLMSANSIVFDDNIDDENVSVSYIALDNEYIGKLLFEDKLRDDSQKSIEQLRQLGIDNIYLLTGDRQSNAETIGKQAGIDKVHSELLPEDKLSIIRSLKKDNCVLSVGDGINDAPALKESNVGIAMGAMGSDVAVESSDIALMNNNIDNIPFVIDLSKRTRRIIYQNLVVSIVVSFVMISLSAFGLISALIAAILHNVGAFVVLINSARLRHNAK